MTLPVMTNSFQQLVLSEETSRRLAVQTPWGLVQPNFLPEGVSPASGYLQSCVMEMFKDFSEWDITNVLLLAHNEKDACDPKNELSNKKNFFVYVLT